MTIAIITVIITKMKIALVSSYAFTDEPSGVKEFILGLKEALQKKDHNVIVIAPGSKEAQRKGLIDFTLGRNFRVATAQTEFRFGVSRKKTARKILKEIKPDIIVIHEPFVPSLGHTIISAMPDSVIVGQFHARKEEVSFGLRMLEFIGKHIIRRPEMRRGFLLTSGFVSTINKNLDGRIAVSHATKKFWHKRYEAHYKIIYNGISTEELIPIGPKIKSWQKKGKKIILFAGRHDGRKGIDDLIRAFYLLVKAGEKNLLLKITGKGEMTGVLQEMVKKLSLGEYIEFVGVLSREELIKAYRTTDLVVAPSIDGEGFNRTIAEARSCGALVVCTNIEGQREAIGHDLYRFMARPNNPESLATQIKAVLTLPNIKKQQIIRRGTKDVRAKFDWSNIANEHLLFYKSLIAKYGRV